MSPIQAQYILNVLYSQWGLNKTFSCTRILHHSWSNFEEKYSLNERTVHKCGFRNFMIVMWTLKENNGVFQKSTKRFLHTAIEADPQESTHELIAKLGHSQSTKHINLYKPNVVWNLARYFFQWQTTNSFIKRIATYNEKQSKKGNGLTIIRRLNMLQYKGR